MPDLRIDLFSLLQYLLLLAGFIFISHHSIFILRSENKIPAKGDSTAIRINKPIAKRTKGRKVPSGSISSKKLAMSTITSTFLTISLKTVILLILTYGKDAK
jgi:hypothetical protein